MPRDFAKYFTCINRFNHHNNPHHNNPLGWVLVLLSPFIDQNKGRVVKQLIQGPVLVQGTSGLRILR